MTEFDPKIVEAVTGHMNGDHPEDNLLIVRAFGYPDATVSSMTGLDGTAGVWSVDGPEGEREVRVEWPGGSISERAEIRREVVALYHAACERLGVAAREEHAPEQPTHGEHGAHGAHGAHESADDGSLAHAIRTATWGDHGESESSVVMEDIMRMRTTKEEYASLVVQHYYMYEALEEASKQLAADPRFASLHPVGLVRAQSIAEDLEYLLGTDWRDRIEALPATAEYAERIREIAAQGWLPGLIAHHYTRYLGDLSGGQMIAKRVAKQFGFERLGVAFYDFSALGSIADFKATYREVLNELGESLDEAERERMIDEVRLAYRFNSDVFVDMQKARDSVTA